MAVEQTGAGFGAGRTDSWLSASAAEKAVNRRVKSRFREGVLGPDPEMRNPGIKQKFRTAHTVDLSKSRRAFLSKK